MPTEHVSAALRRQVRTRARGLCEYCRCPARFTNAVFHCEHIFPREGGGRTTFDNNRTSDSRGTAPESARTTQLAPHPSRRRGTPTRREVKLYRCAFHRGQ